MILTDNEQKILDRAICRVKDGKGTEEEQLIVKLIHEKIMDELNDEEAVKIHHPYIKNGISAFRSLEKAILDCFNYLTSYTSSGGAIHTIDEFVGNTLINKASNVECCATTYNKRQIDLITDAMFTLCERMDPEKEYYNKDFHDIMEDEYGLFSHPITLNAIISQFAQMGIIFRVRRGVYKVNPNALYDGGEIECIYNDKKNNDNKEIDNIS